MSYTSPSPGLTLLKAFLAYLAFQGKAAGTRAKYGQALEPYVTWLDGRHPATAKADDVWLYLAHWSERFETQYGRAPKTNTRRNQVTALKSFYEHLERFDQLVDADGKVVRNPMLKIDTPTAEPTMNDFLSKAQDDALLAAAISPQERILVWLLRFTGMRVSEACSVRISDIHLTYGNSRILVPMSKTKAGLRTIPIFPELAPELVRWLEELEREGRLYPNLPLLSTSSGKPMRPNFVDRVIKRVAGRADIRPTLCTCGSSLRSRHTSGCPRTVSGHNLSAVSSHTLRRTFATDLRNRHLAIDSISKLLGHSSTATTEAYYAQLLDPTIKQELADTLGWAA